MTPIEQLPELLRVPEAAAWLDISPWCVYELIKQNKIAHVKLGRLRRVTREGLQQIVASR